MNRRRFKSRKNHLKKISKEPLYKKKLDNEFTRGIKNENHQISIHFPKSKGKIGKKIKKIRRLDFCIAHLDLY